MHKLCLGIMLLAGLAPASAAPDPASAGPSAPAELRLRVGTFDPRVEAPELPQTLRLEHEPQAGYFVVQFREAIDPQRLERVRDWGAEPIHYLPDRAYVVRLSGGEAQALRSLPDVRWVGPIQPGWKIAPDLGSRPLRDPTRRRGGRLYATVDLFPGEDLAGVAAQGSALGAAVLGSASFSDTRRLELWATRGQLERLARIPGVAWIDEAAEITPRMDRAPWVVQTNVDGSTTVWDMGLHGENQIIGHIDGPLDIDSCFFIDSVDNTPGPGHRKVVAYRSNSGTGADTHGTHTAGIAAGDEIANSLNRDGLAWAAKLSHTNLNDVSPTNFYGFLQDANQDGAHTHTNSWGEDGTTAYTTYSRDIDLFSYDFEDDLVLFAVSNSASVKTPENAKNVLAVSASGNGTFADDHCLGGTGPTADGRRKPEIHAPGCGVQAARAGLSCSSAPDSGTSMASPLVAGGAALVRQYFEEGWYPTGTKQPADALTPSGALVKAALLNSTVDMTSVSGYPSDLEGWGRVLLENVLDFSGDARRLVVIADERNANGLSTGGSEGYTLNVTGAGEDLRVTLVFTEPAGALMSSAPTVNDLDLEVTSPTGTLYRGNNFSGGVSAPGGSADPINNAEVVLVPSPEVGEWIVSVKGTAVNQGTQGYAVVATGEIAPASGVGLLLAGSSITDSAPLGNGDGIADPGESITLPLSVLNRGPSTATSVTSQLSAPSSDPVQITGGSASFPDIGPNQLAGSLAPHHVLTIDPTAPCGNILTFDVDISDSSAAYPDSLDLQIGEPGLLNVAATDVPKSGTGNTWTIDSTINVPSSVVPDDVLVTVDFDHTLVISQLTMTLTSPQSVSVTLHNQSGSGTTINGTYDTELTPDGPGTMNDFDGQQAQGNWTLTVTDAASQGGQSPGTLQSWSLTFSGPSVPPNCNPLSCGGDPVPPAVGPDMTLDVDGGTDLRFTWSAVSGASGYRVWRSDTPDFALESFVGSTAATTLVEANARVGGTVYYLVRAVNSCEWEGP